MEGDESISDVRSSVEAPPIQRYESVESLTSPPASKSKTEPPPVNDKPLHLRLRDTQQPSAPSLEPNDQEGNVVRLLPQKIESHLKNLHHQQKVIQLWKKKQQQKNQQPWKKKQQQKKQQQKKKQPWKKKQDKQKYS